MAGFVNTSRVINQVSRWGDGAMDGARDRLRREFEIILAKARDVYCPVETGDLRASARLEVTDAFDQIGGTISFGGGTLDYAVVVHERLDTYHEPPTQAKFLERARDEQISGLVGRVAVSARREARRRIGR